MTTTDHQRQMLALIDERDRLEALLDKFAQAVAPTGVIGEHSSANNPWTNALGMLTSAAEVEKLRADNAWLDRHYRQAQEADEALHEKLSAALGLDEGVSWDALIDKVKQLRTEATV